MGKRNKKPKADLLSEPVDCIDGENIYVCHWTGKRVKESEMILTPPCIPQILGKWPAAPGYEEARRESYIAFCDWEQNCNTCRHLERIPHDKCQHRMLYGKCKNTPINHPSICDGIMTFHADDSMAMECYESRFKNS